MQRRRTKTAITVVCLVQALSLLLPLQALAEMYKWVDENNVTHYTQEPPIGYDAQKLREQPAPAAAKTPDRPRTEKKRSAKKPDAEELKKKLSLESQNAMRCSIARKNLALLQKPHNIIRKRVQGKLQVVSFNDRGVLIERQQQEIKRYCHDAR